MWWRNWFCPAYTLKEAVEFDVARVKGGTIISRAKRANLDRTRHGSLAVFRIVEQLFHSRRWLPRIGNPLEEPFAGAS